MNYAMDICSHIKSWCLLYLMPYRRLKAGTVLGMIPALQWDSRSHPSISAQAWEHLGEQMAGQCSCGWWFNFPGLRSKYCARSLICWRRSSNPGTGKPSPAPRLSHLLTELLVALQISRQLIHQSLPSYCHFYCLSLRNIQPKKRQFKIYLPATQSVKRLVPEWL